MAWMKVPEAHKPLYFSALPDDDRVSTIKMFGSVAMMVNGYMTAGLWADSVMVRVGEKDFARALKAGGEPFDPMGRGTPMANTVLLPKSVMKKKAQLRRWLNLAMEFSDSLPAKKPKKKKAVKKKAVKKKAVKKKAVKKKAVKKKAVKKKAVKKKAVKSSKERTQKAKKSTKKKSTKKKSTKN